VTDGAVISRMPPVAAAGLKARRTWRSLLPLLVGGVFGGCIGFVGAKFGSDLLVRLDGPKALIFVSLATLPLVWLLVVAVHEFGHVVGGWLTGGKLILYVVGPFMWKRTPAGLRFSWNTNVNIAGGLASCLPIDLGRVTPRRLAFMIAGGPVSSVVLAVAALWLAAWLTPRVDGLASGMAQHVALFTAAVSVLIFLVTAMPGTAGGFKTDGRRFLDLLRGDARSGQEQAMIALTAASLAGVRPGDYDPRLVAQAVALRDGSLFDLYAHLTVFPHAVDLGQPARAQALLDHVVAGECQLVPFARDTARCEYAWLLATHTADAAAARAWLDSAGKLDFDPATSLRAEAAVLLAEGRKAEAAAKAREGLHALEHRSLSPVKSRFAEELLEQILSRAEG
jgi:hypothetical protein